MTARRSDRNPPPPGHEGIQSVSHERAKVDGAMALVVFDVLQLDGQDVKRQPWTHRRKRLQDLFEEPTCLVWPWCR